MPENHRLKSAGTYILGIFEKTSPISAIILPPPKKNSLPKKSTLFLCKTTKALGDLTLEVAAGVVEREVDGCRTICTGADGTCGVMGVNWL